MKRHQSSPIITREQLHLFEPGLEDVSSVFNPGAIHHEGRIVMLLRVQDRGRRTHLVKAVSRDGVRFRIDSKAFPITGLEAFPHQVYHIYDPRIVRIEGIFYITCAVDCSGGCRVAVFSSSDLESMHYVGTLNDEQQRNGVLFDQKIEGRFWMLSRPNEHTGPDGVKSGSRIFAHSSDDLRSWKEEGLVMEGRPHFWDELIGPGPPPIRTSFGWILIYHGVATHFGGGGIYQAGMCLLDLDDPRILRARGELNVLEPREMYELTGQVPNVVFPTACVPIKSRSDGTIWMDDDFYVYYGAADTCIGLAVTSPRKLLENSKAELICKE
ncbi:MAG TPA: hypothetical protein GX398_04975 [Candidatus Cloacimonetes bacterium]|nr:hypothetical protein [Candidatus Cloacimonadota bacterium]